ncbi:MAG: TIGR01459 family HAD-type hydrolase [Alphaproteobacteria bacterium]|nr:TIGR01459 family HAD-type hydrolase [Alphaproteobacteria bacterium]
MITVHDDISAIAERYDGFILDLWGVLHDGTRTYPGVPEAMRRLHDAGKRIALLSNAPRRSAQAEKRAVELGVPAGKYDLVMTSGEDTWHHFRDRPDDFYRGLGRRCFHIGPERDENLFDGVDLVRVDDVGRADFLLNSGPWGYDETLADHEARLQAAAARGLPMVCANPDLIVMVGLRIVICAGTIARRYEELGGVVRYHGKPHRGVYDRMMPVFDGIPHARICAIGDTLRTDVAGAAAFGLDSFLVTGGVHAEEFGIAPGGRPDPALVEAACRREGHRPTGALVGFR